MAISVIISNFNGGVFLPRLLESIRSQRGVETEIVVVDRYSRDDSTEILKSQKDVTVIQERPEKGLVAGYAAGARIAKYDHLFFCNEDMWFDPDCLKALEAEIDLDKRIGGADPWQWTYDGLRWIHGGVRFRKSFKPFAVGSPYPFYTAEVTVKLNSGDRTPMACAGAFLIHKKVLEDCGGWDRSFFLDLEDVDLFIRAWQKGWKCVTVPEAKGYHAVGASNTKRLKATGATVQKRRYISSRASAMVIAIKYFSPCAILLTGFAWKVVSLSHLLKLRLTLAVWDILALAEVFKRLPGALKFRRQNSYQNRKKPGENFFKYREFYDRT